MQFDLRARPVVTALALFLATTAPSLGQEAFLDRDSAAPGETVQVFVSNAGTYTVEVYASHDFGSQTLVTSSGPIAGQTQGVPTGSHAEVPTNPSLELTSTLSLEAWVMPTADTADFRGILSKYSIPGETAYNIYLMPSGQLSFYLGQTGAFSVANRLLTTAPLPVNQWTHIAATYDGSAKRIYVNGQLDAVQPRFAPIFDNDEPVRVGSYGSQGTAAEHFTGTIDAPAIYDRALTPGEVRVRYLRGPTFPTPPGCVAMWNFDELKGTRLKDLTANGNHLTLVNNATRAVAGPVLTGEMPVALTWLLGTTIQMRPTNHAVRFAADDAFNPPWISDHSFVIPPGAASGLYSVRVGGKFLPLVVRPDPTQKARIAVLAATNTWAAYNSWRGNLYGTHLDGRIRYYVGLRQPNPGGLMNQHSPGGSYSHLVDAERYLLAWLPANGYPFDLYADIDLHREPDLLDDYDVLVLQGHSEYWTHEMVDHVEALLERGGSLVNLSGNTMWSVVTFDPTYTVMEGRKHPHSAATIPDSERWHSQRKNVVGGTFRCVGRPEHAVLGTGYGVLTSVFGHYEVTQPSHWAFAGTGLAFGSQFGQNGLNGGGIMGHEVDIIDPQWSPANIEVIAHGAGYGGTATRLVITNCASRLSVGVSKGGAMAYFDHPGGGGVFTAPTIAYGGSLPVDAPAGQILRNVLDRFLGP